MHLLNLTYQQRARWISRARPGFIRSRVAVWDSIPSGHDEVLLPLLWTLQGLRIPTVVYRNAFRHGSRKALETWYEGEIHKYDSFHSQNMSQVDTILLLSGDHDTRFLLEQDLLEKHPHLQVLAMPHVLLDWNIEVALRLESNKTEGKLARIGSQGLLKVAGYVQAQRWQFLVLSSHVAEGLVRMLEAYPGIQLAEDILRENIHTFVPIMPIPRALVGPVKSAKDFKACIIGRVNSLRAYRRIIAAMRRAQKLDPAKWWPPHKFVSRVKGQVNSHPKGTFELSLLGKVVGKKPYRIPPQLKGMIREYVDEVGYLEFQRELQSADIVLPAFSGHNKKQYTSERASGAIPAAIMAHVPVLVDKQELRAYTYLEPPAYILREGGENEIEAIARVREERGFDNSSTRNETVAWEKYEDKVYDRNRQVLQGVLLRSKDGI